MTPEAADWVYDVVLTQRFKESAGAIEWTGARENRRDEGRGRIRVRECPCEWRLCGRCADGRPDRCAHRDWTPSVGPVAYIQNRRGGVVGEVWPAGKPCAWLCSTVVAGSLGQLELFALAGGAR